MKLFTILTFLLSVFIIKAQNKTSGLILLDSNMSLKLDLDCQNSKAYLTLTGPSDRWFAFGLNSTTMSANVDCVVMTSDMSLTDSYFPGGYFAPLADNQNDWTLIDNVVSNSSRTIRAVRDFVSPDSSDYLFQSSLNSLDVIWAYSFNPIYELYDPVNSGHGGDNYGHVTLFFSELGANQNNKTSYVLKMFPIPINTDLIIIPDNYIQSSEIEFTIYDSTYKVVYHKSFFKINTTEIKIPFSNLPDGLYFIKSKIDSFESFKKLIVKK